MVFYSVVQKEKQNKRFPAKKGGEGVANEKEDSLFSGEKHAPCKYLTVEYRKIVHLALHRIYY